MSEFIKRIYSLAACFKPILLALEKPKLALFFIILTFFSLDKSSTVLSSEPLSTIIISGLSRNLLMV